MNKKIKKLDFGKIEKRINTLRNKSPRLPINKYASIDLIPDSHKDLIAKENTSRGWRYAVFLIAGLCALTIVFGIIMKINYAHQINVEKSSQQDLTVQISQYADVDSALTAQKEASEALNKAAGAEVNWGGLLGKVNEALPEGTRISSMSISTGGVKDTSSAVTLNLSSSQTLDYSDVLQKIKAIDGLSNVQIGGLSMDGDDTYVYTVSFNIDTSILTQKYKTGE